MTIPPAQTEAADFLAKLAGNRPIETHISAVFVGADAVWKMKKAVALPYLDFTALAERRRFLKRELALNQPAAPGLYRDVVALVRAPGGELTLGAPGEAIEWGEPIEWVLRMARIPAADFLDHIAVEGRFTPELARTLGRAIARYHQRLPPLAKIDHAGSLRRLTAENHVAALAAGLPEPDVLAWEEAVLGAIAVREAWLAQRSREGCVRRAHGDLHLGNLCLWQGVPVPFDALEFDERLASIDVGFDLAFLLMDLDQRRLRAVANEVLCSYVAESNDVGLVGGLPLFLSLRAMVRAHVQSLSEQAEQALQYLTAAAAYLRVARPTLIAIGGLSGSGKSSLARALAPELGAAPGALVLASDIVRKYQHGALPEERLPEAAYGAEANKAVAAALVERAALAIRLGHSVIVDATFIDPTLRAGIEGVAGAAGVRFLGLWLEAPLAVLEARVAARSRSDAPGPSDATVAVLRDQMARGTEARQWQRVAAAGDAGSTLAAASRLVRERL